MSGVPAFMAPSRAESTTAAPSAPAGQRIRETPIFTSGSRIVTPEHVEQVALSQEATSPWNDFSPSLDKNSYHGIGETDQLLLCLTLRHKGLCLIPRPWVMSAV